MDNIRDYIGWMGDRGFDTRPLGVLDAMVLCAVSYFDLNPMMDSNGSPFYLKDAVPNIENGMLKMRVTGGDKLLEEVLLAAAKSRRFGDLIISNYADELEKEKSLQFAAVGFSFRDEFSLIAYRGTDNTLVGWKEDFMLAYTKTEAQKRALEYAEELIEPKKYVLFGKEYTEKDGGFAANLAKAFGRTVLPRRWYIAGHSKGGNLAMFAAAQLPDEQLELVERVFVLDGPGSSPEALDPALLGRIDGKTTRVIPDCSIVGRLMEPQLTDTRVVQSSAEGVWQHALQTWGVEYGDLLLAENQQPQDRWINRTLRDWIESWPYDKREIFVDEFFEALSAGGANTVEELLHVSRESADAIIRKAIGFSEPTRQVLGALKDAALKSTMTKIGQTAQQVSSHVPSPEDIISGAKRMLDYVGQEIKSRTDRGKDNE